MTEREQTSIENMLPPAPEPTFIVEGGELRSDWLLGIAVAMTIASLVIIPLVTGLTSALVIIPFVMSLICAGVSLAGAP